MALAITSPEMEVGRLAVQPAVVVDPAATIAEAAALLREADVSSALVGDRRAIITERDFTTAWAQGFVGTEPAVSIAATAPVVIDARTPIVEAATIMLDRRVRHLVVAIPEGTDSVVSLRAVVAVLLQAVKPDMWMTGPSVSPTSCSELWLG